MKAFFNNHLIGYLCTYAITLHLSGKDMLPYGSKQEINTYTASIQACNVLSYLRTPGKQLRIQNIQRSCIYSFIIRKKSICRF